VAASTLLYRQLFEVIAHQKKNKKKKEGETHNIETDRERANINIQKIQKREMKHP
jgi:hypothetical protein